MAAVHRASRGIPRVINLICEHALIAGYVDQLDQISESVIQSVAKDLDLDTQPFIVASAQENFGGMRASYDREGSKDTAAVFTAHGEKSGGYIR